MSIILGTITVLNGKAIINAPQGFDTLLAVRVTNGNATKVVRLNNINGTGQSQELLFGCQQMVYKSPNISAQPYVDLLTNLDPTAAAGNVYIEWSSDPATDFLGTYPFSISQGPVVP